MIRSESRKVFVSSCIASTKPGSDAWSVLRRSAWALVRRCGEHAGDRRDALAVICRRAVGPTESEHQQENSEAEGLNEWEKNATTR